MGETPDNGWQTVLPTSHHGVERLSRAQLESYERQVLKDWASTRGHWSGVGKHTSASDFAEAKKLHPRFRRHENLGSGTYGIVEKVNYTHKSRSIFLARKWIQYRRGRTIQMLREEANVMEKLDHEHIVKLVGTYCTRHNELYLLLWPVAVCNLEELFNDLDCLRTGKGDRDDLLRRLEALDVTDLRAVDRIHRQGVQPKNTITARGNCPLRYLQQTIGCIAHAVAHCHEANIRHLDLKPTNILLSPGKVYLADFGIARDVNDRDHTMTFGLQGTPKWRAPEICDPNDEWSMKAADVYSLGLILLNIATVLYGAPMADFDRVVDELNPRSRAQKLKQHLTKLEEMALATQEVCDAKAHTFAPKHIVDLTSRMLSSDPSQRPNASQIDAELVDLGGVDQIYHAPCCRRSSIFVTDRINMRYKVVADERDRMMADNQRLAKRVEVLEGKDETYEERLKNERKAHAQNMVHLQEQLDKERKERSRLEGLLAERRQRPSIPRPGRSIPGVNGDAPGLIMRMRPPAQPLPSTTSPASFPSASAPQTHLIANLACMTTRTQPTYSQAAGGRLPSASIFRSSAHTPQNEAPSPTRVFTPMDTNIPSPSPSPNPNATGFSLRSRGSGSRLPRLVNPSTPIRSGTPSLQRDPSLTDSTQYSMSSSTFSRVSGLSRDSESAVGSPAVGGVPSEDKTVDNSKPDIDVDQRDAGVGLGLQFSDVVAHASEKGDVRDRVSVVSSGAPGSGSPELTASALSSPCSVKAELQPLAGGRVPPLPTAKSWADVARRQRRA